MSFGESEPAFWKNVSPAFSRLKSKQTSMKQVWHPRTRRWTRHTDNVAGSSDVSSKKLRASRTIATTPSDSSNYVMRLGQSRSAAMPRAERTASFVSSAVTGTERGQCKSSNELLMMWGEVSAHRYRPPYRQEDGGILFF
jgi:hypothetical protein